MKRNLSLIALAGLAALTLGSCKLTDGGKTSTPNSPSTEVGGITINKDQTETLAYQAVTGLSTLAQVKAPTVKERNRISDEVKTKIESILPSVDLILSSENTFDSVITESDLDGYAIKQTISFTILNATEDITLYYNVISEKIDNDDDNDDDDYEDDIKRQNDSSFTVSTGAPVVSNQITSDQAPSVIVSSNPVSSTNTPSDIEMETEIKYEGLALIDDISFPFIGKTESESETEDGETEVETEMEMRITTGEKSYINIKQEIEVEGNEREEEYKYTVVENGVLSLAFAYEFEDEKDGKETEVKLVLDNVKYEFEAYNNDQASFIKVKIEGKDDDDSKVIYQKSVIVDETTGETSIIYTLVE